MLACLALALGGCASTTTPLSDILSAVASQAFASGDGSQRLGTPNPAYRYLRVQAQDRAPAFLVLGYIDPHPLGDIEVWYSAQHEVIKTQNGRIVGTAGLEVDWRAVQFPSPPPLWGALAPAEHTYQRLHDEMPGYRFAITEQLELRRWLGLPPIDLAASLPVEQARRYTWFRESTLSSTAQPRPPAWYAWGIHRGIPSVVYSMQCLSDSFCLTLQPWPVQESPL